ncbi:hypothetical protein ECANGB1_172 [Enterospora canceri]|uniref:Uncharacterized protein n=1 Tax=Enterospora canceri TaxID=1081671 RepID=A0A1Y1S4M6_9MICR|nr:hypothetical protein ECANGB1_172 [Enterospora canceri]
MFIQLITLIYYQMTVPIPINGYSDRAKKAIEYINSVFDQATVSDMNKISALLKEKFNIFQQVNYKHSNAKLSLEMGIGLITANANNHNILLLNNMNLFAKESNDPMIGAEQAKISYERRNNAIETHGREIRRCRIKELKLTCESVKSVINDLVITVSEIRNYIEIGRLYKKKHAELNMDMNAGIINMIIYMESMNIDEYRRMIGELNDYLKKCEIFTEM